MTTSGNLEQLVVGDRCDYEFSKLSPCVYFFLCNPGY